MTLVHFLSTALLPKEMNTNVTPEARAAQDNFRSFQATDYANQNLYTNNEQCMARAPNHFASEDIGMKERKIEQKNDQNFRTDSAARVVYPIPLQANGISNPFQMAPVETSKASQQLTVNGLVPMCFYGVPNQYANTMAFRMPGKENVLSFAN